MIRDLRFSNEIPVQHMWSVLEPRIESVRRELAAEFGCDPEEMAITRNASESLETMIFGIDLARGDEVIVTTQNYPRMITSWEQRARRDGIVVKRDPFPVPPPSAADVVERFRRRDHAEDPRHRGHAHHEPHRPDPAGEATSCALGRERGIEVFVDGAHAFAHFPFKRDDLECDYYATSLHKWLFAPIGTGFLYVRKEKIRPLAADGGARERWTRTSASTRRSARTRRPTTTPSPSRSPFTAAIGADAQGGAPAVAARPLGEDAWRPPTRA